jgi:hypothetical protein
MFHTASSRRQWRTCSPVSAASNASPRIPAGHPQTDAGGAVHHPNRIRIPTPRHRPTPITPYDKDRSTLVVTALAQRWVGEVATSVIYVHGAGSKPPSDDLKREWDQDLFSRDMGDQARMAYYADLLHDRPGVIGPDACTQEQALALFASEAISAAPPAPSTAAASATAIGADEEAPTELDLTGGLTDQGQEFALSLLISMAARATSSPVVSEAMAAELLPVPPSLRRKLLHELLRRLIPDADKYFFTDKKEPIRQRLREALDAVDGPVVVVSHSLGTVIAYDVLSEQRFADRPVPVLVTAGSPLGYTEIQDVIIKPLRVPRPVRLWANFADPLDVVTLDTGLSNDFVPATQIADVRVANPSPNHHAPCGYLRANQVRAIVGAAVSEPG